MNLPILRRRLVHTTSVCFILLFLAGCGESQLETATKTVKEIERPVSLSNLPVNEWIKYHEVTEGSWWRRGHASMVYDSNRSRLIVFGSDTHGEDWDNIVHEFDIEKREWVHHGKPDSPETYGIHPDGHLVAGIKGKNPWAMHTYDGVAFDKATDTLIVVSIPLHNPRTREVPKSTASPIWLYDMESRNWSTFSGQPEGLKAGFGAATAYDSIGKDVFICSRGLWRLNLGSKSFEKMGNAPNCLHVSMSLDSRRRQLYLFGDYKENSKIRRLTSGLIADRDSRWEVIETVGDKIPSGGLMAVAYDQLSGVFLLTRSESKRDEANNLSPRITLVFDPDTNALHRLPDTLMTPGKMNFMLAWDDKRKLFFLVNGNSNSGIEVWVLRLNRLSWNGNALAERN